MGKLDEMKAAIEKQRAGKTEAMKQVVQTTQEEGKAPKKAKKRFDIRMPMEKAKGRLPDGSKFAAIYAAEVVRWVGTLTLPTGEVFEEDSGAVMKLLKKLDLKYREWLEDKEKPLNPGPGV